MHSLSLRFLCASLAFLYVVAQPSDSARGGLTSFDFLEDLVDEIQISASSDVETAFVFPDFPDQKVNSGEIVEVLVGFRNTGNKQFNISSVDASLNWPEDFSYYIQNFTEFNYDIQVQPHSEVSLQYLFKPDPLLEPREFGLVVNVFYVDSEGLNFTNVLVNTTIDIIENDGSIDAQTFFSYLAGVVVVLIVIFGGYRYLTSWSKTQKKMIERGTTSGDSKVINDWLVGTSAEKFKNKKE